MVLFRAKREAVLVLFEEQRAVDRERALVGHVLEEQAIAQLVAGSAPRYHYWLQDPVPPDGSRELGEALRIERRPGLLAIGGDPLERDLGRGWRNCDAGGDRALTKEHVEAAPEAAARHQAIAPRTARGARAFKRWESSRARSL